MRETIPPEMAEAIGRSKQLPREAVLALVAKAQKGDVEARNQVIESNLKMLARITRKFCPPNSFEDCFQAGVPHAIRAIELFDVTLRFAFNTYMGQSFRKGVIDHLQRDALIRTPSYLHGKKARQNPSPGKAACLAAHDFSRQIENETCELYEVASSVDPVREVMTQEQLEIAKREFSKRIKRLSGARLKVFRSRLKGETLLEIGQALGLSRERIRQLEVEACRMFFGRENAPSIKQVLEIQG